MDEKDTTDYQVSRGRNERTSFASNIPTIPSSHPQARTPSADINKHSRGQTGIEPMVGRYSEICELFIWRRERGFSSSAVPDN